MCFLVLQMKSACLSVDLHVLKDSDFTCFQLPRIFFSKSTKEVFNVFHTLPIMSQDQAFCNIT